MSILKKLIITLASAGVVTCSVIASSKYLSSITMQEQETQDENKAPSLSGYSYHSSSGLSDGIHTVNTSQKSSDLESVMKKIRRETE